ncbi:MAG: DUF1707 domain-containing protein [Streptosporangiales bacterium]|nr:DUF1707 domain-containing protein [Streptosporangiales bacterium]
MTDNADRRRRLRIGDAEREAAIRDLGEHFAAGRLSEDEHSERIEQASAARTQEELDAVFTDLPRDSDESAAGEQQAQWHGPPWAQHGPPPWAAWGPQGGPPRRGGIGKAWRWLPVPFLVLAVLGAACAISKGFFPFFVIPLLAIATVFFVLGKKGYFGGDQRKPAGNG